MPLYIKDDHTADLVAQLARQRGVTKQDAVRLAVQAALDAEPLAQRLKRFWEDSPMPPPTGLRADKAFFDALSGEDE